MMIRVIVAFLGTVSFSLLFNVPSKYFLYCGLIGASGWISYTLTSRISSIAGYFIATLIISLLSRIFAISKRAPVTLFLISGIFPIVPGAGVYYTAYYFIDNNILTAINKGMETLKIASVIGLGITIIFLIPRNFFKYIKLY